MKNSTIILADDLTGANDTALQYFKKGYLAKILIDYTFNFPLNQELENTELWAFSTESRNIGKEIAYDRTIKTSKILKEHFNIDNFYKKMDSTLRGNSGVEIVAMLETLNKDLAIVAPAYIEENRYTIGGYQLLNNNPIERSFVAVDPKSPVKESYIPDILNKDLNEQFRNLIGLIDFKTVSKGAGPIQLKINELYQKGKKIIVADAMSKTDLEQISLAIDKSNYDILPCGSAGLASAFNKSFEDIEKPQINLPKLPRLIISGSATNLTLKQIEKLKLEMPNIVSFDLKTEDIIEDVNCEMISSIVELLNQGKDVLVHSSYIQKETEKEEGKDLLIDAAISKDEFPSKITDFLANLTYELNLKSKFILISLGGETSFKCAFKMNSKYLEILDAILPAIPLCKDFNDKFIVTKSGNFGNQTTLIDIINYFNKGE